MLVFYYFNIIIYKEQYYWRFLLVLRFILVTMTFWLTLYGNEYPWRSVLKRSCTITLEEFILMLIKYLNDFQFTAKNQEDILIKRGIHTFSSLRTWLSNLNTFCGNMQNTLLKLILKLKQKLKCYYFFKTLSYYSSFTNIIVKNQFTVSVSWILHCVSLPLSLCLYLGIQYV